jgi:endoglucanase
MKTRTLFLSLGIALLTASCGGGSTTSQPANDAAADTTAKTACANFKLGTGVNVSHWLSQSDNRGEERANQITKKDFDSIAAMGFDHVRLPIDEVQMYDENMNRHEEAFALMKNAIDWTLENNMNIIIDLHIIRSFHFNARPGENTLFQKPGEKEKLIAIWKDLQSFLKDYPNDRLAYELLNEAIAPSHEELNELEARLIASIRETEP